MGSLAIEILFGPGLGDSDAELGSSVNADSAPKALFRIQTGQNCLSAVAKNFVPQTGHVRGSRGKDLSDSAFTASAVLERRLAHGSRSESWQPGPRYLPLSCHSLSSRTRLYRRIVADQEFFSLFSSLSDTPALEIDL
jgi:hypothetical protein